MNKKILVSLVCMTWSCLVVKAQLPPSGASQIGTFFPAAAIDNGSTISTSGQQNLNTLIGGYIAPLAEDFGSLGNSAWYNTGATHKKWGFDISVSINAISSNSDSKYFGINALSGVSYDGTTLGGTKSPTVYGPEGEYPKFHYTSGPNSIIPTTFLGPSGGNISKDIPVGSLAVPTVQVGLGLFANTDLRVRYTPETSINGTKLGNWGVGVMHDIKQHIPGIKMAPIGLSLLLAYSQATSTTDLGGIYYNASTGNSYGGQEAKGDSKNYTAQVLISKSIPVFTFYGGLGFNSSTTTYAVNGSYYVDREFIPGGLPAVPLLQTKLLTNPFSQQYSVSGIRFTGGVRLKFGPIFLNGDYTYFNSKGLYTLGFGVTVR
jgi:hypothetical protein